MVPPEPYPQRDVILMDLEPSSDDEPLVRPTLPVEAPVAMAEDVTILRDVLMPPTDAASAAD